MEKLSKFSNFVDSFYQDSKESQKKMMVDSIKQESKKESKAKHTIGNYGAFSKSREILGNIITQEMKTSGGMDVDWLVEHNGGFIILEIKSFHDDRLFIPLAQMIAYVSLYKNLNHSGRCFLFVVGIDDDNDFTNPQEPVWIFELNQWLDKTIPHLKDESVQYSNQTKKTQRYFVERAFMTPTSVQGLRELMESAWQEFER